MTTTPVEFILTPNSILAPSIHHIEKDIDQVIRHCNSLVDNMNERKQTIIENDFNNPTLIRPWLDDMINKANEVLNALLRLRKYQLAAEYRIQHRSNDNDGRKRPVFQGRCHSCNISETPEWRRGPDGARTLCNACGLHYAKLSRKKKEESIIKDDTSMK
ncbi:uncharacterized protein BX663DRAFT_489236 [Cokeromyces recurvatus]|uniref:uncharacterized protein n=1 Tax=Cokeromyces recurvatus TaxID=90255 RepID=UPI002220F10B|nr:uncharacterized protein BX663DRAFT_489236 [Cokeromyces recurvatus]KAI7899348.1 hypothetical protein BX663DRAFT_489236 [Cokeromyces recurvatus]